MFKPPVQFVPAGLTPEEARRARKRGGAGFDGGLWFPLMMIIILGAAFFGGLGWFFWPADTTEAAPVAHISPTEPAQSPTYTPTANPTPTPAIYRLFMPAVLSLQDSISRSPVGTPTLMESVAFSPVATPPANRRAETGRPTPPPTATATPAPVYAVLGESRTAGELYSYVSGWVLEADKTSGRPVVVKLAYTGGAMSYPRPNNTDIATGHYEFLASPGNYTLQIEGFSYPVTVGDNPERIEISVFWSGPKAAGVARSNPWASGGGGGGGGGNQPTPTPTPRPQYSYFLPIIANNWHGEYPRKIYLPVIWKQ